MIKDFRQFTHEGKVYHVPQRAEISDIAELTRQQVIEIMDIKRMVENLSNRGVAVELEEDGERTTIQQTADIETQINIKQTGFLQVAAALLSLENESKPSDKISFDAFINKRANELENLPAFIALKCDAFFFSIGILLDSNLPHIGFLMIGSMTLAEMN
jgi:hypothetical protein